MTGKRDESDESKALEVIRVTPPTSTLPAMSDMQIMVSVANNILKAGEFVPKGIDSSAKAFAVMLAGWELGLRLLHTLLYGCHPAYTSSYHARLSSPFARTTSPFA